MSDQEVQREESKEKMLMLKEMEITGNGVVVKHLGQLSVLASMLEKSGYAPKGMNHSQIFIAGMMGAELNLSLLKSAQSIAVINGRPTMWGDTLLGIVRASGLCESFVETQAMVDGVMTATATAKRKGQDDPIVGTFSMADAKTAGLAGKSGPWTQYPRRMLQARARSFCLRDAFPDVLGGMYTREEAQDWDIDMQKSDGAWESNADPSTKETPVQRQIKAAQAKAKPVTTSPQKQAELAQKQEPAQAAPATQANAPIDQFGLSQYKGSRVEILSGEQSYTGTVLDVTGEMLTIQSDDDGADPYDISYGDIDEITYA